MREAGFSSTQIKTNVEQAVSLEVCSHSSIESTKPSPVLGSSHHMSQFPSLSHLKVKFNTPNDQVRNEDVTGVLDSLMSKNRRNTVVVGECLASAEGVVRRVIDKFNRGDVPIEMRNVQFISLPLLSLKNLPIDEAQKRLGELRSLVKGYLTRGVVLYLGDLQWVSEFWSNYGGQSRSYYCPVELMIMELSRLLGGGVGETGKLWLMGISTFKTYMRCRAGQPSLQTLWQLHPLTIPVGSLGLSLNLESDLEGQFQSKVEEVEESKWSETKLGVEKNLTCCKECFAGYNKEAQSIALSNSYYNEYSTTTSISSSLPSWLQKYKQENKSSQTTNDQELNKLKELCKKWNSICSSIHKQSNFLGKALNFSSSSPCSSSSISSHDQSSHNLHSTLLSWPAIFEPKRSPKEHQFLVSHNDYKGIEPKPDLLSNPNSSPNSASSSEANEGFESLNSFKELNPDNLKMLCNALERKVPWQKEIIPEIATTILECRSGVVPRKGNLKNRDSKEETWLSFLGLDSKGKEKVAKELAKVVFGSKSNFVTIGISSYSSTRADSSEEEFSNKRAREESGSSYLERFAEAVEENPSRVFFMEDLEQVDYFSQKGIKKAIESGRMMINGREPVPLRDAIVIFCGESLSSISRACSPPIIRPNGGEGKEKDEEEDDDSEEDRRVCGSLDLNLATGEDSGGDQDSVGEIGILDSVDRQIIFKIQVL